MKKTMLLILLSCTLYACSNATSDATKEVLQQEQYSRTHTAYADSATLRYALDNAMTPDSAVVALGKK